MRHFNFHENGGPYPGTCISCGNNRELFDLGAPLKSGGNALLCLKCIGELAIFTGYTLKEPVVREFDHLKNHIASLEAQLKAVPNLTEGLINGIRNSVSDFVLAVSSSGDDVSVVSVSAAPKSSGNASRNRKAENSND